MKEDNYLNFRSLNDCGNIHLKIEKEINDRITKLENKFKSFRYDEDSLHELIREQYAELKKKVNDLEDMQETIVDSDPVRMQGQIAEFRGSLKALGGFSNEHAESIVENMDEIAELKENHETLRSGCSVYWNSIYNIKEVLRELNQIVKGIAFDLNKEGILTAFLYIHYKERLQENEEKLDSPKQMEKKEGNKYISDFDKDCQRWFAKEKFPEPKCPKCGRETELDLITLDKAEYMCFWCDDFHVKAKEKELIEGFIKKLGFLADTIFMRKSVRPPINNLIEEYKEMIE